MSINDPAWEGEGCNNCGNDDGPHRYKDLWWCLDCLERCHPGDETTDVLVHDHEVGTPAIDPDTVDPIHLPRLGGLT